ncbi:hypothetical protein Hanom_Chr06g00507491 [Helianthus anomalus]
MQIIYKFQPPNMQSNITVSLAFRRHDRKALPVGTVVVNGVLLADPLKTTPLVSIKILKLLLVPPPFALCCTKLCVYRRLTTVHVETFVCSHKWCL